MIFVMNDNESKSFLLLRFKKEILVLNMSDHKLASVFHLKAYLPRYVRLKICNENIDFLKTYE